MLTYGQCIHEACYWAGVLPQPYRPQHEDWKLVRKYLLLATRKEGEGDEYTGLTPNEVTSGPWRKEGES